mmetsp:Transcript_34565/g.80835  ORF Transcript_34565/g.80835 Transcript_34565/m.80835 type:complete len:227 (+) Transcript_34565:357-1037(+)
MVAFRGTAADCVLSQNRIAYKGSVQPTTSCEFAAMRIDFAASNATFDVPASVFQAAGNESDSVASVVVQSTKWDANPHATCDVFGCVTSGAVGLTLMHDNGKAVVTNTSEDIAITLTLDHPVTSVFVVRRLVVLDGPLATHTEQRQVRAVARLWVAGVKVTTATIGRPHLSNLVPCKHTTNCSPCSRCGRSCGVGMPRKKISRTMSTLTQRLAGVLGAVLFVIKVN